MMAPIGTEDFGLFVPTSAMLAESVVVTVAVDREIETPTPEVVETGIECRLVLVALVACTTPVEEVVVRGVEADTELAVEETVGVGVVTASMEVWTLKYFGQRVLIEKIYG